MRFIEFKVSGLHGYINMAISFERNPLIIIAPNGSGKTSSLKLMQALVTPSLGQLLSMEFSEASLRLDEGGKERVITAKNIKGILSLAVSGVELALTIPTSFLDEVEVETSFGRKSQEVERALRLKYADHPAYLAIAEISAPVFLGLDRRGQLASAEGLGYDYAHRKGSAHKLANGQSMEISLSESKRLIHSAFRRIRRIRDYRSERLRNDLLFNGFEYQKMSDKGWGDALDFSDYFDLEHLESQRRDLLDALKSIAVDPAISEREVNSFFDNIKELSVRLRESHSAPGASLTVEAIVNKSALGRLRRLIEKVRAANNQTSGLSKKFESFVKCMNIFLSDSGKEVAIDSIGSLKFTRSGKVDVPLEALSSGEKHLVIMFSHLFFNSFGDKSNIFVIDEPEVSLHLRWQDLLLAKMVESSPRAQIIVATHSPEIVGEYYQHCVDVSDA